MEHEKGAFLETVKNYALLISLLFLEMNSQLIFKIFKNLNLRKTNEGFYLFIRFGPQQINCIVYFLYFRGTLKFATCWFFIYLFSICKSTPLATVVLNTFYTGTLCNEIIYWYFKALFLFYLSESTNLIFFQL